MTIIRGLNKSLAANLSGIYASVAFIGKPFPWDLVTASIDFDKKARLAENLQGTYRPGDPGADEKIDKLGKAAEKFYKARDIINQATEKYKNGKIDAVGLQR